MTSQTDKLLLIFSENKENREILTEALSSIFHDSLTIISCGTENIDITLAPKAVIVTESTVSSASTFFPNSKIIFAHRIITGQNLGDIIMLPTNTSALVVNEPQEAAIETVKSMFSLGINHLNLTPYWAGSDLDVSLYENIIYTGFKFACPPNKSNYINIGYRQLTLATIVEIIRTYDLPSEYINDLHKKYTKIAIDNYYTINSFLRETRSLKDNLEYVCNLSENAIITINPFNQVSLINPAAEHFLGTEKSNVIGLEYQRCFTEHPLLIELLSQKKNIYDLLIYLKEKPVLVTINMISIEGNLHSLMHITPVEQLQQSETKIRTKLHKKGFTAKYTFEDIKGNSNIIQRTINLARQYAKSDATILITGKSGTGKELFAQAIHNSSIRSNAPFVGINFAALPESIAESELFGYEEGAFTGATKGGKMGLFEIAHNGTIFLDEIGDASPSMQIRLLRVIEEREIIRVGSSHVIPINIRIICATNKNLSDMVKLGTFREDLFYRIRVLPLNIPSLTDRKSDIPLIVNSLCKIYGVNSKLPDYLLNKFLTYDWPGNIRELKTIVQFFSVLENNAHDILTQDDILHYFFQHEMVEDNPLNLSEDLLAILKEINIANTKGTLIGRYSLSKLPKLQNMNLTETKIKVRLNKLVSLGLINIGKTKQGVTLTDKGLNIITNQY